jgi:hypothetical protein
MNLPEEDEAFLRGKGFDWSLCPDGDSGLLVIRGFPVNAARYDHASTDLMIRIPAGYNMAKLDMWYVDPPLRLKESNQFPHQAAEFEQHGGRRWQRFSRHLPDGKWRAGIDGLPTFLALINSELR